MIRCDDVHIGSQFLPVQNLATDTAVDVVLYFCGVRS